MKLRCPHCRIRGQVPGELSGKVVRCPRCRKLFTIPERQNGSHPAREADTPELVPPSACIAPANNEKQKNGGFSDSSEWPGNTDAEFEDADNVVIARLVADEPRYPDLPAQRVFWGQDGSDIDCGSSLTVSHEAQQKTDGVFNAPVTEQSLQDDLSVLLSDHLPDSDLTGDDSEHEDDKDARIGDGAGSDQPPEESAELSLSDASQVSFADNGRLVAAEDVSGVLRESWRLVSGVKTAIWIGIGCMFLTFLLIETGIERFGPSAETFGATAAISWITIVGRLAASLCALTILTGLMTIGVCQVSGQPRSWRTVFAGFPVIGKIVVTGLLILLLIASGFVLLILPGIYLAVGYSFALPLIVDRGCGPWAALELSRQLIHQRWWFVFSCYFVMFMILVISCIPFGIGAVWAIPMSFVLTGVLYRHLTEEALKT